MKNTTTENKKISFDGAGKIKQLHRAELPNCPRVIFFLNSDLKICMHDILPIFFCFIRLYLSKYLFMQALFKHNEFDFNNVKF